MNLNDQSLTKSASKLVNVTHILKMVYGSGRIRLISEDPDPQK